jgi:phosphonoacetaldehyde hydrolase
MITKPSNFFRIVPVIDGWKCDKTWENPMKIVPLTGIVLDWAGTVVDFGSRSPIEAFRRAFDSIGLPVHIEEVRQPMGMAKRDHIANMLAMPRIADAYAGLFGHAAGEADIDALYERFLPFQAEAITDNSTLIPGALDTMRDLRRRGMKIGSSTGYPRPLMAPLIDAAAAQGYTPDMVLCAGDTPQGRPSPMMVYKILYDLELWPASACVKAGDTVADIDEGRNAGLWTVGCAVTGNEVGLSAEEWEALPAVEQDGYRRLATDRLLAAGAHIVIDGIHDLPAALDVIEERRRTGERP